MSNAAFVLVAIGVSIVLSLLLWLRHRKPRTFMSSVDDFQKEMSALGRRHGPSGGERRWSSLRGKPGPKQPKGG